jgi:hypothetical protein
MERVHLRWSESVFGKMQLSREEFALLIGGIDPVQTRQRNWYRKPAGDGPDPMRKSA